MHLIDTFLNSIPFQIVEDHFTYLGLKISNNLKGIVHFEIHFSYVLAYLKGIQEVGVFCFHSIFNFDTFRSNRSCLSGI